MPARSTALQPVSGSLPDRGGASEAVKNPGPAPAEGALQQLLAGLRGGAGERGLQAGIEAGQRLLGNRDFMRWVEDLPGAACPRAGGEQLGLPRRKRGAPLQLMGKKKKKPGAPEVKAAPLQLPREQGAVGAVPGRKQWVREEPEIPPAKTEFTPRERRLFGACITGNADMFRRSVRFGKAVINVSDDFGTLLCHAAYGGHAAVVRELLLMPDIDVNLAQQKGATPLYLAAQMGHTEVAELLVAAQDINVNLVTKEGATPLHIAVLKGYAEIVEALLAAPGANVNPELPGKNETPLLLALHLGREQIAGLLLDAPDIDVDKPLSTGLAPIHYAVRRNLLRNVEQLVRRGADVNLVVADGLTPLFFAAENGYLEVARALLQAPGIRVNQAAGIRYIPLGVAAQYAYKDIVRLLLKKGADPNIRSATGLTPLNVACLHGHMAIVQMLLHFGADTDAEVQDPEGARPAQTPYSLAELGGHRGIMSVLAAHRRHGEAASRSGQLPITGEPERTAQTPAASEAGSLPVIGADAPVKHTSSASPEAPERKAMEKQDAPAEATPGTASAAATPGRPDKAGTGTRAAARTPLALAQDALRQEVLGKLRADNLEPLEGIRLLEDVNAADSLDALCSLYNRLAHIERHKERARRAGKRREAMALTPDPEPASGVAPEFVLEGEAGMDAERVEVEIKRHLGQAYQRFVSQAVNDMEFGRGKPTTGHRALWHVSAGIPDVGSCSVFYYLDAARNRIRIVGIGHHVRRAAYQLDYAAAELGNVGRVLRID